MDTDLINIELLKAGIKVVGDTLTQLISNFNKTKLEEKKNKNENRKNDIQLLESEKISGQVDIDLDRASLNIRNHTEEIRKWASGVKFLDLDKRRTLSSIYVQLDTFLIPAKRQFSRTEREKTIELEKAVLNTLEHCVILGQPGAGKTTSMKKVCEVVLKEKNNAKYTFPILLRLREIGNLESNRPIFDHICDILPVEFSIIQNKDSRYSSEIEAIKEETVWSLLNHLCPILILDGFDELKDQNVKSVVLAELRKLTKKLNGPKIVLSCRTGEFSYELDYTNTYEIAALNDKQIELFVNKWLKDPSKANDFLAKVKNSPFADTSIKPLSLAHLCVIYERIGDIPDQAKTIYKKVVRLLIEEWDEQRSIIRTSAFSGFQSDQKSEFLAHLSYYLTVTFQSSSFTVEQFKEAYEAICESHSLPKGQANHVVKELESHTGLFIESGYEKFEFVHKSIQEYLAADHLVKLPSLNTVRENFETLGSELAIAVSISSNSSLYFIELILNYFSRIALSTSFYNTFISRIISENPSFKDNELVSSTTMILLSLWLNPDHRNFNEYKEISISEDFYNTFVKLSEGLKLKEQKTKISKFYIYNRDVHEGRFVELLRINQPKEHKRLPSKIYLPMEFYMDFSS